MTDPINIPGAKPVDLIQRENVEIPSSQDGGSMIVANSFAEEVDGDHVKYSKKQNITINCCKMSFMITISCAVIFLIFTSVIYPAIFNNSFSNSTQRNRFSKFYFNLNKTFLDSNDTICHRSLALIEARDYKPFKIRQIFIKGFEHCEVMYYFGSSVYISPCIINGHISIIFIYLFESKPYSIIFPWEQFCALMFTSQNLIDDLNDLFFY